MALRAARLEAEGGLGFAARDDVDLGRDAALVLRFQGGDTAAFDDLYRRYFMRLRRFCERRVGDPIEAEELAQEAFVRALGAMPRFAGERRFYPWMTVIASRLCIDSHRRRDRATPMPDIDPGIVEAELDELFAEVDRAQLSAALQRLAPRHREVLDLRERVGWSYQQIADHYGVNLGTIEALLHRARRSLRREFERVTATAGRSLAAVPVIAWCTRTLAAVRARVAEASDLATPLSATVASVAIAAGSFVVAAPHPPRTGVDSENRAVVALTAVHLGSASATGAAPPALPTTVVVTAPATPASSAEHRPVRAAVDVAGYDTARRRNDAAAIHDEVGGISVGADPSSAVADTLTYTTSRIPGSLP